MIKVDVSDKEVKIVIWGDTFISHFEDIIEIFKTAKTEQERRNLTVILCYEDYFEKVSEEPKTPKKLSSLDLLESCIHSEKKFSSYDKEIEDELDELLGANPYTPLM